jgi:hypothetical protein
VGVVGDDVIDLHVRFACSVIQDRFQSDFVIGIEPTLDLSTVAIAEHDHDSSLRIDAIAARAHDAQGAHALVASEHVVVDEPEAFVRRRSSQANSALRPRMSPAI